LAGDVTVVGEWIRGAGFWIDRGDERGSDGGGWLVLMQVGREAALLQPASHVGEGRSEAGAGVLLVLGADLGSQGRHQLLDGVAFGKDGGKLFLSSRQRLTGDPARRGEVGAAEGVERGRGGWAGAELLTAAAVTGGQGFRAAGRGMLEELLENSQGVGVEDRRDVAGAEGLGCGGVLAATPDPPLAEELPVGLSAGRKGAMRASCRVGMSLGSVVLS
jgi:hypothetical protein